MAEDGILIPAAGASHEMEPQPEDRVPERHQKPKLVKLVLVDGSAAT